jgi:hypothetical protein
MKNGVTLFLLFLLIGFIPMSCGCFGNCGCDVNNDNDPKDFYIRSLAVETSIYIKNEPFDSTRFYPFDSIAKSIVIDKTVLAHIHQPANDSYLSFSTVALACTETEPGKAKQTISSILLTSQTDTVINDSIQVKRGEQITKLFSIVESNNSPLEFRKRSIVSYLATPRNVYEGQRVLFSLMFNKQVAHSVHLVFDIVVKLDDGSSFIFENETLNIR